MSGLGKGLGSLIPQRSAIKVSEPVNTDSNNSGVLHLPIDQILPNPEQPRMVFNHAELEDMVNSIREHGIIMPLVVTKISDGHYELIAGERRLRAAKIAGLKTVPAVVREASTTEKLILALVENIQRQDLNPIEEAKSYDRLIGDFGLTQEDIAKKVGKARPTISNTIRLLGLPLEIQQAISSGTISMGSARALLALPDTKRQIAFFKKIIAAPLTTTRAIEENVRNESLNVRKNPALMSLESALREKFGVRVVITKRGIRGQITFSFANDDEYESLSDQLTM